MSYFRFARHQTPLSPEGYFLRRQEQRNRRLGHEGWPVRVEQIAHADNLYRTYQILRREGGQAPGVDGRTYDDLGPSEVGFAVRGLAESVASGTYRPQKTRPVSIPKTGGGTRTLQIAAVFDRVLGKALYNAWTPFWETVFLPCSYGFRPRRSSWDMLADLEVAILKDKRTVLAIDDLKSAFDNIPIAPVIELFRQAMNTTNFQLDEKERQGALLLIETVLRGHDRDRAVGLHQGNPFSPLALNVLLHELVDTPLCDGSATPSWFRYADNIVYAAQDVPEGRASIDWVHHLLQRQGLTLKGQDGVVNLAGDQIAPILGYTLRLRGGRLYYGLRNEAISGLTQSLIETHESPNPPAAAAMALLGWMDSVGPAFEDGVARVALSTALDCGLRTCSGRQLRERGKASLERWRATRERAYRRRGLP